MLRFRGSVREIAALFALLLVLFATPAWAVTTGSLRVIVSDSEQLPVPGASVELSGVGLAGGNQLKLTDASGEVLFVELVPGTYEADVTFSTLAGARIEQIKVDVGRTSVQPVTLKPQGALDDVIVYQAKAVDTESTTRGQVLDKAYLQKVPAGRSYQQALSGAVGVTGEGGNKNLGGGATNENTYMLDGANITDPVTGTFSVNFNFDAIQQIEVLLGGYMPEYGVSVGGVVNLVTESGTNTFLFDTSVFYSNANWSPKKDARFTPDAYQLAPTGFDSAFETIALATKVAGPLVRDKAFFIISYQMERSIIAATGIPQPRDYEGHYMLAKLTVAPTSEHRLTAFIQLDPTTIDNINQSDPYQKPEAQGRQAQGGYVSQTRWQWFLAPKVNTDTQFVVQKTFIEVTPVPCTHDIDLGYHPCAPDEAENTTDWETPGRIGLGGAYDSVNWGYFYFDDRFRYQASTKLSLTSVKDPFGGSHDFKFGLEGDQVVWDQIQGYSGNLEYFDINQIAFDPQTFLNYYWFEITGPIKFRTTGSTYSAFAQDSWKPVSNLTINYGTRFDNFVMRNDLGEPVLGGNLLGPRLYGAWDPFGDAKTKIATGWGRFNDTSRLGVADFTSAAAYGSKLYLGEYFDDGAGQGFLSSASNVVSVTQAENLNIAHDQLRTPRVDEITLQLEREIVDDVALFSRMAGKFSRFMYEPDETNLIYDSDGSAVIGSRLSNPDEYHFRLRTPLLAKRDYFQWDLGATKVQSRRWAAQATYTYTQSLGSSTSAISGSFINDAQTQYNYGPLNTDISHVVKSWAYWDLPTDPWKQSVGALFEYYSGIPEERLYISEGNGAIGYGLRIQPRGTYLTFGDFWRLGAKFSQDIDVRKGKLVAEVEVANITNNQAPYGIDFGLVDAQNRLVTTSRQQPLELTLGLRYQY